MQRLQAREVATHASPWSGWLRLLLALALVFINAALQANPVGPTVTQGQATFDAQGNRLTVTNTPGTVINWQQFNIPAGSQTHFQQQDAASSVLNRVISNDPSRIFGTLSSNGRVILVNGAGIVVGAGAVVDTAGFMASTLQMSDADRLLRRGRFAADGAAGSIQIDGMLRSTNGDIVLIAPQINVGPQALVRADNGAVMLAAGQRVELTGRGLEGITLELQAPSDKVVNLGRLEGDAVGLFAGQLRHSGAIQARTAFLEGGRVVLRAADAAVLDGGTVDASGTGAASSGGRVTVEGRTVDVRGSRIQAEGSAQGGQVLVGGGWQGRDASVSNSQSTRVDQGSRISVSGSGAGSAGKAVVWSDGNTRFDGRIDARGGEQGGNGGQVEVSGKEQLAFSGFVSVAAPQGTPGSLLLDPKNLIINSTGTPITATGVTFPDGSTGTFFVDLTALTTVLSSLSGGTLTLQATNDISFATALSAGGINGTLLLEAGRNVDLGTNISLAGSTVSLVVIANSPGGTSTSPWRDAGAGSITQNSATTINVGSNGQVYLTVGNGVGGGGTITVGNIVAGKQIFLDNIGTGGGIAAHAGTSLQSSHVLLRATGGSIGSPLQRVGVNADKFSVSTTGDAYIAAQGPSSSTRLGAATPFGGSSAQVSGVLDIAEGSAGQTLQIGGSGTDVASTTVQVNTLSVAMSSIKVGSNNANGAGLYINATSGGVNLNATAGDVTIGGNQTVAPVAIGAQNMTVQGSDQVRIEGASFSGLGPAPVNVNVSGPLAISGNGILPTAISLQGGGEIGSGLNITAGSISLNAPNGGVLIAGATSSAPNTVVNATSGRFDSSSSTGFELRGGNAGNSGVSVSASAGEVSVTVSVGNITVTGGPGPVGGTAQLHGETGVTLVGGSSGSVTVQGAGKSAEVTSNMAGGNGVTVNVSGGNLDVRGGNLVGASAAVSGFKVALNNTSAGAGVGITGGTANGAFAEVTAGNGGVDVNTTNGLYLTGGTGAITGAYSRINSAGGVTVNTAGSVNLLGADGTGSSASIKSTAGGITVTAAGLVSLQAGSGTNTFATIEGNQSTRVSSSGTISLSGSGPGAAAQIKAASGNLDVSTTGVSGVNLTGGAGGTSSFAQLLAPGGVVTIAAPRLVLTAGTSPGTSASVEGQSIDVNLGGGPLTIDASTNPAVSSSAFIQSTGNTSVTAGNITLNGNSGNGTQASIYAGGGLAINSSGNINLYGGAGTLGRAALTGVSALVISATGAVSASGGSGGSATASINSGPGGTTITAASITLTGGGGTNSVAGIQSGGPIALTGAVNITGGAGSGALAGVTTSGVVTITGAVTLTPGTGPDADAIISASNGVALAASLSLGTVTSATRASSTAAVSGVLVPPSAPSSDPSVSVSGPGSAIPGSSASLTVTVVNLGPDGDTVTVIIGGLPGGTQTQVIPGLAPGTSATLTISYSINPGLTGSFVPIVSVTGINSDTNTANNLGSVSVSLTPQVNFGVTIGSSALTDGTTNTVPVIVANTGPSVGGASVIITLPGGSTQLFTIVSLAPGGNTTTNVLIYVPSGSTSTFGVSANVSTVQPDTSLGNNLASQVLTVAPPPPPPPPAPAPTPTPTQTVTVPAPSLPQPTTTSPQPSPTLPSPSPTLPNPAPPPNPTPTPTVASPNLPPVPPPGPTPPPTPVSPAQDRVVDRIIQAVGNPSQRPALDAFLQEQDTAASTFVSLLVRDRDRDDRNLRDGENIVVTEAQCRN